MIILFEPKEMRSDTYVHNFEHAIEAYYKGAQVSDYQKRNLFFEALSAQQRNAMGCQKITGTYLSMVKAFRHYNTSKIDAYTELLNIRMCEGEAVAAFANRFQGLISQVAQMSDAQPRQQAPQDPG